MILRCNIGKLGISFIFHHYWEQKSRILKRVHFRQFRLGLFFEKNKAVGTRLKGIDMFKTSNLVPCYIIGVNLIWFEFWFDISWGKVLRVTIPEE